MPGSDTMSENTDTMQAYQKARADFDVRWQAALSQPALSEIRVSEAPTQDALLDRMLTGLRELALACAQRGLIDAQRRDAIHAAVDEIKGGFAGIARTDLAEVMRSTSAQPPTQAPQEPPKD
jgi:hypothetical protein